MENNLYRSSRGQSHAGITKHRKAFRLFALFTTEVLKDENVREVYVELNERNKAIR